MKKVTCMVLVVCMLLVGLSVSSAAASVDFKDKISKDLLGELEKMDDSDEIRVYVFLSDVDNEEVMKTFSERYPKEYEIYMKAKNSPIDTKAITISYGDVNLKDGLKDEGLYFEDIDDALLQKAIGDKRSIYREYYLNNNTRLLDSYCTKAEQFFVSSYSPLAILNVSKSTVMRLAESSKINLISKFIEDEIIDEGLDIANAITRADYVRDGYGNSGNGVIIGQYERYVPYVKDSYLKSADISVRAGDTVSAGHPTRVARVLVGTHTSGDLDGLAPDAKLYCCSSANSTNFYSSIEWLLNMNVNVINMSASFNTDGTYDIYSTWVDHIAVQHDVHFVKTAGNTAGLINSPGMAYNAITVGGLDDHGITTVSSFDLYSGTCFAESGSYRPEKPNLVAPACDFWGYDGTSYAAPQVAGTIAQLCSFYSPLKVKQTAVGAILAASSAEKVQALGNGAKGDVFMSTVQVESNAQVSNKEGAGILDSQWARGIVWYGNYWSYTINKNSFPYYKNVSINATTNSVTRVAIFWLKRNSLSGSHINPSTWILYPLTNLNLTVYDPNNNVVGTSTLTKSNFEIVQFVPTVSGTYRIRITQGGCTDKEHVGIAVW